ncbi:MAG TPA: hypothetical protein VNL71_16980 [Chloroflexota bacterium]|nr:hypothetical protein [Chloroflexota bacterium]
MTIRARQAAALLGADRLTLPFQDRLLRDTQDARLAVAVPRLFFSHCKMEPSWGEFAFAVDVSAVYDRKRAALAAYGSIFAPNDRLVQLYEAEDQYVWRLLGVAFAESFRSLSPLLVADPTMFLAGIHG